MPVEIKPGPELDCAVAKAIGLPVVDDPVNYRGMAIGEPGPSDVAFYSTDLNAAFAAAERVHSGEFCLYRRNNRPPWKARILRSQCEPINSTAATPALAICAAILKLKEPSDAG